jgi:hypothetical protein
MWEPQPLATLRASTACTGMTLRYLTLKTINLCRGASEVVCARAQAVLSRGSHCVRIVCPPRGPGRQVPSSLQFTEPIIEFLICRYALRPAKLIQKSSVIETWKYGNKANSRSANQEVSHLRWGLKVHYRVHKSPESYFKPHEFSPHHHTILLSSSFHLLLSLPYSH